MIFQPNSFPTVVRLITVDSDPWNFQVLGTGALITDVKTSLVEHCMTDHCLSHVD